jgi:hypothetical protein
MGKGEGAVKFFRVRRLLAASPLSFGAELKDLSMVPIKPIITINAARPLRKLSLPESHATIFGVNSMSHQSYA